MKKLFISIPMKDKTREEIEIELSYAFAEAEDLAKDEIELIDSLLPDDIVNNYNSLYCLGCSIQLLSTADYVYFAEGWDNSRGCKLEHACAIQYRIPILKD